MWGVEHVIERKIFVINFFHIFQVFAVVEKAGTIVMNHGEELDSWSVIVNGSVDVTTSQGKVHELQLGDR